MSNSTLKYIGKRLVISLITLFVILMVLFLMVKFLPGSPINNEKLSASARAAIEAQYGLDQPIPVQFVRYIQNMLTGDFGVSFNLYKDMQVSSLVGSAAKLSMIYGLCAVVIGTVIGMFLGVFAALHKNTIWDTIATVISVIGVSIPSFVFAMLILLLFASKLRLLPTSYRKTLIFKHALRNALIPVITILGPILVNLMTGTMVVEKICSVPGLGKLLINSILSNDYNIILACSFLYAAMYIFMMLIIDISYGIIDPRIRLGKDD